MLLYFNEKLVFSISIFHLKAWYLIFSPYKCIWFELLQTWDPNLYTIWHRNFLNLIYHIYPDINTCTSLFLVTIWYILLCGYVPIYLINSPIDSRWAFRWFPLVTVLHRTPCMYIFMNLWKYFSLKIIKNGFSKLKGMYINYIHTCTQAHINTHTNTHY